MESYDESIVAENTSMSWQNDSLVTTPATANESDPYDAGFPAEEYIFDRFEVRVIFVVLYSLVFCTCFFGNLLVILVVTLHRRLRSTTNLFLANLAVADLCVAVFCVYQNFYIYLIPSWVLGDFFCKMYQFVHSLSYTASIFILVVICTERYFAIIHPITCKQILTPTRLRLTMALVWVLSAAYSAPRFRIMKTITNPLPDNKTETICVPDRQKYDSEAFDMCNFVLLYAIPLLLMTILYARIALGLWATTTRMRRRRVKVLHRRRGRPLGAAQPSSDTMRMRAISGTGEVTDDDVDINHSGPEYHSGCVLGKGGSNYVEGGVNNGSDAEMGMMGRQGRSCRWEGTTSTSAMGSGDGGSWGAGVARKLRSFRRREGETLKTNVGTDGAPPRASRAVLRARRGVVRMLVVVVVAFAACNLPLHARKMWQYWSPTYRGNSPLSSLLTPLTFLVSYANSGINPLLYAFMSRNFRKGMKELLRCSGARRGGGAGASSVGGGGNTLVAGGRGARWNRQSQCGTGWDSVSVGRKNGTRSFRRNGSTRTTQTDQSPAMGRRSSLGQSSKTPSPTGLADS